MKKIIFMMTLLCMVQLAAGDLKIAMNALEKGNFKTAFRHLKIAAEEGDPVAQQNLAVLYNNGIGVKQNREQAAYWMEQSAQITESEKVALR
ncbi:MAG: hypothetical protein DSZ05_06155 [Sulfurospirillum sp.]|nr:MAG: hypothetical protein DSZ05_06155 [Sulfurospirillum sp.]